MNDQQKKDLREEAIRDSGIVERVKEFRHFCNRYHQLTPSKQLKDALVIEVHTLERKASELKLGALGRGGLDEGISPEETGTEDRAKSEEEKKKEKEEKKAKKKTTEEEKKDATEAEKILKELAGLIADIQVDSDSRFNDLILCNQKLNEFITEHEKLKSVDDNEKRRNALDPIAESIKNCLQQLGPEIKIKERFKSIMQNLKEYIMLVERLKTDKKLGRHNPARKTVYSWIYPKFLRAEYNKLYLIMNHLNLEKMQGFEADILASLSELKQRNFQTQRTGEVLYGKENGEPGIETKFGSLPKKPKRKDIIKQIKDGKREKDNLVAQKTMEIELLDKIQTLSQQLRGSIKELDKIVRLNTSEE